MVQGPALEHLGLRTHLKTWLMKGAVCLPIMHSLLNQKYITRDLTSRTSGYCYTYTSRYRGKQYSGYKLYDSDLSVSVICRTRTENFCVACQMFPCQLVMDQFIHSTVDRPQPLAFAIRAHVIDELFPKCIEYCLGSPFVQVQRSEEILKRGRMSFRPSVD